MIDQATLGIVAIVTAVILSGMVGFLVWVAISILLKAFGEKQEKGGKKDLGIFS